jgi:hypothetical protein
MVVAACNESLDAGAACPVLCPAQNVIVRDTILDAVTLDTTVGGFPLVGTELSLFLAARGDTVDVRGVVRYDSLTATFTHNGLDSAITTIDSAGIVLLFDRANSTYTAPVRFDLYDVDTTAADTSLAAIRALFRSDRLIGGVTLDTNQIKDTTIVPFDNAVVLGKIVNGKRLRVGIQVSSTKPVMLLAGTVNASRAAFVQYDPSPDTVVKFVSVAPLSKTPLDNGELLGDLTDYQVVVKSPQAPTATDALSIGGLEGRRAFLRFNVPSYIIDSATVLRATLLAVQRPVRGLDQDKPFTMQPQFVTAGKEVTDVSRSAVLVATLGGLDSLRVTPADSGLRQLEMVTVLRAWATSNSATAQRALVLRSAAEGTSPLEMQFYSTRAAPALRPRLRVSYATRTNFGIP